MAGGPDHVGPEGYPLVWNRPFPGSATQRLSPAGVIDRGTANSPGPAPARPTVPIVRPDESRTTIVELAASAT